MKNNKNFIYGIAVVTFGAMTIGWIEKGSWDWGGTKPESVDVEAEQVPDAPVLTLLQKNGQVSPTFNLIQLDYKNIKAVLGGTLVGPEDAPTGWKAPTELVNLSGPWTIKFVSGQTMSIPNGTILANLGGKLTLTEVSKLECQPGDPDSELQPFSFLTDAPMHNKVECWIAYTNPETHRIILDNIQRSPLYGGMIEGVGPRYCPSIEDKVVRFAGKDRHPIFVEPCGENTEEMYLQGASSSLPEDVQNAFYRSIQGFEHIEIMRPAYAIEYDCVDPTSLEATLESKVVRGLYGAGQFNGTSGYEEAAAQGLLAGLNAARSAKGESQLILERQTSYLGTLVDDLVTKGVMDPYRMMTSRSEYRLTLRQDNADQRLTPIGREYGLVQDDRWAKYQHTQSILEAERRRLHETHLRTADLRAAMEAAGLPPAAEGGIAEELLRRPEISYPLLAGVIGWGEGITPMLAERLETEIKYAGYIARQDRMIRDVARHEKTLIPADFEYADLTGLTLEAREKLTRIRPKNLGQAGRIPGVSPSDVAQLSIALAAAKR